MSRTILALALASSVSALLPAKVPVQVRGVFSAPFPSSSLLSMRSRPPYMNIDPDAYAKIAAAGYSSGYSSGFSHGLNAAAMVGPFEPGPVIIPPTPESRCKDAAKDIQGVDGPLLQTLATVSCAIEGLIVSSIIPRAKYEPEVEPVDDKLAQPYKVTIGGVGALDVFKSSLASYGTVIDGSITDFHGDFEVAIPPFAALVVQPKNEEAPILILAWRGSVTVFDWLNNFAPSPTLSSRWSSETKEIRAHGAYTNLVENTFSLHEGEIVDLIEKHKVKRAFITGHSMGGGVANVAHLVVCGQLKTAGSPWAKLDGQVAWHSCTFAAPETIVRLYEKNNLPPPHLINELDASSSNIVYSCDPVPRVGMLAYTGNLLEIVVPQIIDEEVLALVVKNPTLGWLLKLLALGPLTKGGVGAVKFLKQSGAAYVMNSLTHLGTVVYQKSEDEEYMYLAPEAKITEELDVEDKKKFRELWGDHPDKYLESFAAAHLHLVNFVPGAVKIPDPESSAK